MNAFTSPFAPESTFASDSRRASLRAASGCTAEPAGMIDPFAARYGRPLPIALRAEAAGMSWNEFVAAYASQQGPLRLGGWSATALPAGRGAFEATIAVGDSIHTTAAIACGPVAGMTAMLHDLGVDLEILSFHRYDFADAHATFLYCRSGERRIWVMGMGETAVESTLRAMIAGANRMTGATRA